MKKGQITRWHTHTGPPRLLNEDVIERLDYISKSLKIPEPELLEGMDMAMESDPELDCEYGLYAFLFDRLAIPKNRGFHSIRYREGDYRVKVVIGRKGAFTPHPEDRDPRYANRKKHVRLKSGERLIWPNPFIPATNENRVTAMTAEVVESRDSRPSGEEKPLDEDL